MLYIRTELVTGELATDLAESDASSVSRGTRHSRLVVKLVGRSVPSLHRMSNVVLVGKSSPRLQVSMHRLRQLLELLLALRGW